MALFAERKRRKQEWEEARQQFFESPPGRARIAFEQGDLVLEIITTSPVDLNLVCYEGWDLVTGSVFPDHTQDGYVLRHYLFKRCEQNLREPLDEWGRPT